jgi:hypothetical protein
MASGKAAPSAIVIGSCMTMPRPICNAITDPNVVSGRVTAEAITSGKRSTAVAAASAAPAAIISTMPSHAPGRRVRGRSAAATAAPIARPLMNATSIALNAYVVGPSTIARMRVQITS